MTQLGRYHTAHAYNIRPFIILKRITINMGLSFILFSSLQFSDSQGHQINETVEGEEEERGSDLRQQPSITMDDLLLILLEK